MILSMLAPVDVVGYYAVASKVAELFRPLSQSLTFVLRPLIASLSGLEARAYGVMLYRRFFLINLGSIVLMALLGPPLIVRFFGPAFVAAVPAFQILLIGLAAHGADGVINGYNVGIGRPEFNSYTALVGLVITVIGDLTFIPTYSLYGAAWVSSVAYTAKAVAMTAIFLWTSGVSFKQLAGFEEYSPDAA
jgi:O-antigen/teichoic acid export membrane protein